MRTGTDIRCHLSRRLQDGRGMFLLLEHLGSNSLQKFEAAKSVRSVQSDVNFVFLLYRLSRFLFTSLIELAHNSN